MKLKFLLQISFLIVLLSIIAFGQNNLNSNRTHELKKTDIKFSISLKENKIKFGKNIELNSLIQNNSSQNISTLPFYIDDLLAFYVIEILNSKGEKLERKDIPNTPRFGSRTAIHFISSEKFSSKLQLNNSYNLPVGKYRITASFTVLSQDGRERVVINSNFVILTIIEYLLNL